MGIVIVYFDGEVELWKNGIDLLLNGLLQSSFWSKFMDNEWILKRILFWDDIIPEEIRFYVNYEYLNKFLFSYYFHHPLDGI